MDTDGFLSDEKLDTIKSLEEIKALYKCLRLELIKGWHQDWLRQAKDNYINADGVYYLAKKTGVKWEKKTPREMRAFLAKNNRQIKLSFWSKRAGERKEERLFNWFELISLFGGFKAEPEPGYYANAAKDLMELFLAIPIGESPLLQPDGRINLTQKELWKLPQQISWNEMVKKLGENASPSSEEVAKLKDEYKKMIEQRLQSE